MALYDYSTIAGNINSVLTGEIWEVTKFGELAITAKIKNVDGLPKSEIQTHEVVYRNKTLRFPKYAKSDGEITITLIEDEASTVRKEIFDKLETQLKDGKVAAGNKLVLGDVELKAYKDVDTVARTYTLKGSIITSIDDSLTFSEEEGAPAEITLTIAFSDFNIAFS
jgi:hypothetical protein